MYDGLKNLEVPKRSRQHPRARKVAKIGLIGLVVLLLAVGGTGLWLFNYINDKLGEARNPDIIVDELLPDEPMNVLILGNDRRDILSPQERRKRQFKGTGGDLTDTILLLHVSPKAEKAVLVSIPRDLRVEIPGCGTAKINSAITCGERDPNRLVRTVKRLTGLKIHHYVSINFLGFRDVVDAVGGVEICVNRAFDDPKSGLKIPSKGCHTLDGNMSLSWVRARAIDPRADLGRVERQQQFIRALMHQVKSVGFLINLPRVAKLADALPKGIEISDKVDLGTGRAIATKLSSRQRSVDFRIVPNFPRYIGGVSYLIVDDADAERLFAAIRNDAPLPDVGKTAASLPQPRDVSVRILNGAGVAGLAAAERARLEELGFDVVSVGDAPSRYEKTVIRFTQNEGELKAELIQEHYPDADVRAVDRDLPADIVIILGADAAARASPSPS